MRRIKHIVALTTVLACGVGLNAQATITFNQNVTPDAIFGSGNANGNFTTDRRGAIELGLRAKIPFVGTTNSNGDGTYSYTLAETDHDNNAGTANNWNFDWTVNIDRNDSSALNLDDYTYELGLDADPSEATNFVVFDPITPTEETPLFDHSIGDNTTANGAGTEAGDAATYATLLANNNVLQQSWRYAFFSSLGALADYNPDVPGTYTVYLLARNADGAIVARTEIQVLIEGAPAATADDVTPDVIFGSGNANGNFTINTESGVEVGIRGKIPFTGLTNFNGDGTYSYSLAETDHDSNDGTDNRWNFDWTINVDAEGSSGAKLDEFSYELGLDGDPSFATDFLVFDPITPTDDIPFYDHSIGDNMTANGGGTEAEGAATYTTLLSNSNVLQQSWRYAFFLSGALENFDPDVPGTYAVYLLVRNSLGDVIARTDIQVLIGGALPAPPVEEDDGEVCPAITAENGKVLTVCL